MKVGIIGSGIVGRVLAKAFLEEGHTVMLGSRNTAKEEVETFLKQQPTAFNGTFEQTAVFGDIMVLAVGGAVAIEAINLAGKSNLSGKLVIDATNPIAPEAPVNGVLQFFSNYSQSLMEQIQAHVPDAKLVKAFSCVGNALMYKPSFNGVKPTMFIAGNDEDAKKVVISILDSFGWETEDMGKAEAARAIEPLCILWCIPGFYTITGTMHLNY